MYDSHGARSPGPIADTPDAPRKDSVAVDEIIDVRLLREYAPHCVEEDAEIIDNIINTSSPLPDKDGYAIMVGQYSNNASYGRKTQGALQLSDSAETQETTHSGDTS